MFTSPFMPLLASVWGRGQRSLSRPQSPTSFSLPWSRWLLAQSLVQHMPILCLTGCQVGRSLFFGYFCTKTRPSQGADRSRAARLYLWASSPLSYLIAFSTNPGELRARRGRCRFGPPAVCCARGTRRHPPGKVPHGVYRHGLNRKLNRDPRRRPNPASHVRYLPTTGHGSSELISTRKWPPFTCSARMERRSRQDRLKLAPTRFAALPPSTFAPLTTSPSKSRAIRGHSSGSSGRTWPTSWSPTRSRPRRSPRPMSRPTRSTPGFWPTSCAAITYRASGCPRLPSRTAEHSLCDARPWSMTVPAFGTAFTQYWPGDSSQLLREISSRAKGSTWLSNVLLDPLDRALVDADLVLLEAPAQQCAAVDALDCARVLR